MKNARALFCAALIACSALSTGCSALYSREEDITAPATSTEPQITLETTAHDPNVPQFLGSDISETAENVSGDMTVTLPTDIVPPVSSQITSDGMIIDDWRTDVDIKEKEDPAELYERYGIDRAHRDGYYRMICADSDLPIIHISTENQQEILSRHDYINCFVEVMNCDDIFTMTATSAGIRVRGNASAFYGDEDQIRANGAPYRIKFNERQTMLGLNDYASCRSWVLLRTYENGIRDYLAFRIAKAVNNGDYYVSDSAFVQLYINEEYAGLYLLCEQTQENSQRIDINEAKDGYEGTDIGYLVELDNYASADDGPFFLLNYNLEEITDVYGTSRVPRKYTYSVKNDIYSDEQLKFIERYFEIAWEIPMRAIKFGEYYTYDENFNLIPAQEQFASAYECINAVIDIQSVVDMYIAYEIVNDQDVGGGSFFFAVDFGEDSKYPRLTMVSPWDFDWAYTDYGSAADGGLYAAKFKDDSFIESFGDRSNPWLILFYSADWFQEMVKNTWRERLSYINDAIDRVEDTVVNYSEDLNKDGARRSGHAMANISWTRSRVEYLNSLWG